MLWPGLAKNLVDTLGGSQQSVAAALFAVVFAWVTLAISVVDLSGCIQRAPFACVCLGPALVGSAAVFGLHLAGAHHFRIPLWYGILFPFGYTVGAVLAIDSVRRRLTGQVTWKGRVYS